MKIMTKREVDVVSDIRCDVCDEICSPVEGYGPQVGTLSAKGGYGSRHDGDAYEVHLCESHFFQTLANLQEQRRDHLMFSEQGYELKPDFGREETSKEAIGLYVYQGNEHAGVAVAIPEQGRVIPKQATEVGYCKLEIGGAATAKGYSFTG